MSHQESEVIVIADDEVGERLDKVLAQRFLGRYSRTYFQSLLEQHLVLLNGLPVKKRIKPIVGDEVEIQFVLSPEIDLTPEPIPLDIIFEDEWMIVVNKPQGMVVHPAPGNWSGTFVNALLYHCQQLPSQDTLRARKGLTSQSETARKLPRIDDRKSVHISNIDRLAIDDPRGFGTVSDAEINPLRALRPGIVHRLDKDTSGVLIAAKTSEMHHKLTELFATRKIYKEYWAIAVGNPGDTSIDAPIARHPVHRKKMAIDPNGRQATSYCKTIAYNEALSFVKIVITTGRTHQIRVHMQHLGSPILGDPVYGNMTLNKKYHVDHQLLHAAVVRFNHPITSKEMTFVAEPPTKLQFFIDKLSSSQIV